MKKHILTVGAGLLIAASAFAQDFKSVYGEAKNLGRQRKYAEAIAKYQEAAKLGATNQEKANAFIGIGGAYLSQKKWADADATFSAVAELEGINKASQSQIFVGLGNAQKAQKLYPKALETYKKALELKAGNAYVWDASLGMFEVYTAEKKHDEAAKVLATVAKLPLNRHRSFNREIKQAHSYRMTRQYDKALALYEKLAAKSRAGWKAHFYDGTIATYLDMGNKEKALEYCEKFIEIKKLHEHYKNQKRTLIKKLKAELAAEKAAKQK